MRYSVRRLLIIIFIRITRYHRMFRLTLIVACILLPLTANAVSVPIDTATGWRTGQTQRYENPHWKFSLAPSQQTPARQLTIGSPARGGAPVGMSPFEDHRSFETHRRLRAFIFDWLASQNIGIWSWWNANPFNNGAGGTPPPPPTNPVPLPAAGWFFLTALLGLVGRKTVKR